MTIESLSPSARDYLDSFNLFAVAISVTGRVFISKNPAGASKAYWCKSAAGAEQIAKAAWNNGDIAEAARRLGVTTTPHPILAARVKARTAKIDEAR
jgi:hypothetical protein